MPKSLKTKRLEVVYAGQFLLASACKELQTFAGKNSGLKMGLSSLLRDRRMKKWGQANAMNPSTPGMKHHEPDPIPENVAQEIISTSGPASLPFKIADAIRNARKGEREACLKLADELAAQNKSAADVARAIRSRVS